MIWTIKCRDCPFKTNDLMDVYEHIDTLGHKDYALMEGNTVKVEWDASWDGLVSKRSITKANGDTEGMGVVYSKVDKDTMKVEIFGMEYGSLSSQSMGSLNFKRQPMQRRTRTRSTSAESK